jgi:hypothetical protein
VTIIVENATPSAFHALIGRNTAEKAMADVVNADIQNTLFGQSVLAEQAERAKLTDLSEAQFNGIVIQSSRKINDETICMSIGIGASKLAEVRTSEKYKKALAAKSINIVNSNLNADITRDQLELKAINVLMERMTQNSASLENMEVLAIAKAMNQAKRRYGIDAPQQSFQPQGNGQLNITQNIVNLTIPSVVLNRLKKVSSGTSAIKTEDDFIVQYGNAKAQEIDVKRVSEVLGVDLSKPNGREATISETYNQLFENNDIAGDDTSILQGEG